MFRYRGVTPWLAAAGVALALALAGTAGATHAPDHRFIVLGYVRHADGRGLPDETVVVTRLKTGLRYRSATDRDGFYLVVVHLHDEDEGERLAVAARGLRSEIVARYDVSDKKVERGTRVDIGATGIVEDRGAFAETLRAFLAR